MKRFKILTAAAVICLGLGVASQNVEAQVSVNIQIGPAPVCPYGYYNYAPYNCAPFGYYGPQWFSGGVFFGAGPWFHGPVGFRGSVNRDLDPRFGYHGGFPKRGEHADWGQHRGWENHWHGNEQRQEYRHDNGNHNVQYNKQGKPNDNHNHGKPNNNHDHDNKHDNDHGHDH